MDEWLGSTFKKGQLVRFNSHWFPDLITTGIVLNYWSSNVYEPASYEVLVEGEVRIFESKHIIAI